MPEGVEHEGRIPSKKNSRVKVFIPLMPEGVEHPEWMIGLNGAHIVFIPLMPEGVEHPRSGHGFSRRILAVFIPLMPEGVEHGLETGKFIRFLKCLSL